MRLWRDLIVAAFFCILAVASAAAQPAERRTALVIGNSAYPSSPLANPVNDARAFAAALRQVGFDVTEAENTSLKDMERAIVTFGGKLRQGGVGLFYYAGHGLQVKGQNYLVPVDAHVDEEGSVRIETVAVDLVTEQMGDAGNRLNVVVLDACRNNPFERRLRGGGRGLAAMDAATGTLIAYATAPGSVAADGEGKNGLYTGELLKAIAEPGLKVEDVFKHVRVSVMEKSRGAQTPWETSSLTGDFYFRPPGGPAATAAAPPAASAPQASGFNESQVDFAYWEAIKDSRNPEAFRGYLKQFPQGKFAEPVRERLEALTKPAPKAEAVAPPKPEPAPKPAPQPVQRTDLPPAVIAALPPPQTKPEPVKPAAPGIAGRWKVAGSGACRMNGELTIDGDKVKAKLADTSQTYDLEGTLDAGNNLKANSTGLVVFRLEGQFPQLVGRSTVGFGPAYGASLCNGVYFTLTKIE